MAMAEWLNGGRRSRPQGATGAAARVDEQDATMLVRPGFESLVRLFFVRRFCFVFVFVCIRLIRRI